MDDVAIASNAVSMLVRTPDCVHGGGRRSPLARITRVSARNGALLRRFGNCRSTQLSWYGRVAWSESIEFECRAGKSRLSSLRAHQLQTYYPPATGKPYPYDFPACCSFSDLQHSTFRKRNEPHSIRISKQKITAPESIFLLADLKGQKQI